MIFRGEMFMIDGSYGSKKTKVTFCGVLCILGLFSQVVFFAKITPFTKFSR